MISLCSSQHKVDGDDYKCILSIPRRNAKVIHIVLYNNQQSATPQRSITMPVTLIQNQIDNSQVDNIGLYSMEQSLASIEIENFDESLISK
jgi:hypothetical protein